MMTNRILAIATVAALSLGAASAMAQTVPSGATAGQTVTTSTYRGDMPQAGSADRYAPAYGRDFDRPMSQSSGD